MINLINLYFFIILFLLQINLNCSIEHPNIINYEFIYDEIQNYMFFIMPYYPDGSLNNICVNDYFDEYSIFDVLMKICDGLRCLHDREFKIIHNNLKPSNILITEDGNYVMSDQCQKLLKLNTDLNDIDYQYMSPEIIKCEEYDEKSDIWSYGCLIYYVITGKSPFDGKAKCAYDLDITKCKYEPINGYYDIYNSFLIHMLCINKDDRYECGEIKNELLRIIKLFIELAAFRKISLKEYDPETTLTSIFIIFIRISNWIN